MRTPRFWSIAAVVFVGLVPATASANTFGSPLLFPDSAAHTMCTTGAVRESDKATAAVVWSRDRVDATDMSASVVSSCTSVTDVRYLRKDLGPSLGGVEQCMRQTYKDGAYVCDSADVTFNSTVMSDREVDLWRWLGCHETGHSLGLGHNDSRASCIFSIGDDSDGTSRFYDGHDLGHINGKW